MDTSREQYRNEAPLLRCHEVSKIFHTGHGKIEVLNNIDFELFPGQTSVLFGKNGQGKSVLLSLLSGLDNPTGGDIYYDGMWLNSCTPKQWEKLRRNHIGIIFQNLNLISSWTALEHVEAALEDIITSTTLKRIRAQAVLEELGLAHRFHHLPCELSMGEQQRVAIARTLVREPRLILADEPTADLDAATSEHILNLLLTYVQKTRAALLVATHGTFPHTRFERTFILNNKTLFQFTNQLPKEMLNTVN